MQPNIITVLFIIFFIISILGQLYLSWRLCHVIKKEYNDIPIFFKNHISLKEHQKSCDYTLDKQKLSIIEIIFNGILLVIFTFLGGINYLYSIVINNVDNIIFQGIVFIFLFFIVNFIVNLPFSIYKTFKLEVKYGFNKTTFKTFIFDILKVTILLVIFGFPILFLILYTMDKMGTYWWIYVWIIWSSFSLLLMWIFPKWIAPIFNKFKLLEDESLVSRINKLLDRAGFKSNGIYVMDGSRRSGHGNAYFTGFGKNKKIVFFDTLLDDMNISQIEAILAHELGHFKYNHVIKQIIITLFFSLIILAVLGFLIGKSYFYQGLGVMYSSNAIALVLFFLVFPVFTFLLSPIFNIFSRKNEYEADKYSAYIANPQDLIDALINLYAKNSVNLVTDNLYSFFYDSHPHAIDRIKELNNYIK